MARAAATRSRAAADPSARFGASRLSYSTGGTSTKMSIRSSSGPLMRRW